MVAYGAPRPSNVPALRPDIGLDYIDTSFENASPLWYAIDTNGTVQVYLLYDHERSSPNRAAGHWHFLLHGRPGAKLSLVLNNLDNIWNGRPGSIAREQHMTLISTNGLDWQPVPLLQEPVGRLRLNVEMPGTRLYVARVEPYRLSDLEKLLASIRQHPAVAITPIGKTVEGRELEIIRIGNPAAPYRVFMRARAHPWEAGGNWVVQGLIRRLLQENAEAQQFRSRYCVYVMPMANKDGVARGWTRFNLQGKDLNRNWDQPADPQLSPENHALEAWLAAMIEKGQRPHLALELHNDGGGNLHISRPAVADLDRYLERMKTFEVLLRKHTWFTEGSTGASFRNPGSMGDGWLERFGIDALVHELNASWIAGLNDYPRARHWERYGEQLCQVLDEYFEIAFAKSRGSNDTVFPGKEWEEASPESQGLDSTRLAAAVEYLKANVGSDGVRELAIVRHGRLVWKGDRIDHRHGVWSCTKSFTSTVLGLLIADGKCTLDSPAAQWVPELATNYPGVTLRHFTTMTSGYRANGDEPQGSYRHGPSSTPFRPAARPFFAPPGSQYAYWDSAMNLFGLVLTRIAGEPLEDLFRRRVAEPIGMTNWNWGRYAQDHGMVVNGGSGNGDKHIFISARDMARFGLLFLNRGQWNGRQLLSEQWVAQATRVHVPANTPWAQPESEIDGRGCYGFNWWANGITTQGKLKWPGAPAGTFAASGHNNNKCLVIPEWQMVIVRLGLDQKDRVLSDETISTFCTKVGESILDRKSPASASTEPSTTQFAVDWAHLGPQTNRPVWGVRGGLLWSIPSEVNPHDGPRGLLRLWSPVLTNAGYDLINFIAIEPVVGGHRGFSELEHSAADKRQGKRLWITHSGRSAGSAADVAPGTIERLSSGVECLTVRVGVERFDNSAHVALTITQRSDAPDELELSIHAEPDSALMDYCILTATMGNKARARLLWLKDEVTSSLKLYPGYQKPDFAPHRFFTRDRLYTTPAGDVLAAITTDESNPAAVKPFPSRDHWRYGGFPVTQYWKKPAGTARSDLQVAVNGRYTYWLSRQPIPGGLAFENFEMCERFYDGQLFVFGITRRTPRELGFPAAR